VLVAVELLELARRSTQVPVDVGVVEGAVVEGDEEEPPVVEPDEAPPVVEPDEPLPDDEPPEVEGVVTPVVVVPSCETSVAGEGPG
jgi:hypothetical protein